MNPTWIDLLFLPTPLYIVFFVISGFLIYGSSEYVDKLRIDDFIAVYRYWIVGIFLFTGPLSLIGLVKGSLGLLGIGISQRIHNNQVKEYLGKLTVEEKFLLRGYINSQVKTGDFELPHGIVDTLIAKGILYRLDPSTTFIGPMQKNSVNIHDWVYEYLIERPNLLQV